MYDRFEETAMAGIDAIMLTKDAGTHLDETLTRMYFEVPIRRLLIIDGNSQDNTIELLHKYPRVHVFIRPNMTTGKAWEILKNMVETPWLVWIDIGKIPKEGWYDEMRLHTCKGDILGSKRINYQDGKMWDDLIVADPSQRLLGGPWLVRTDALKFYHVDDDYAQRNIDIIIREAVESFGGCYHLVTSTSHLCYLPVPVTDKEELRKRHDQNARGIIKYISPEYAREHASYLLNDHWMLMINKIPRHWIQKVNPNWISVLDDWRMRRWFIARTERVLYGLYKRVTA